MIADAIAADAFSCAGFIAAVAGFKVFLFFAFHLLFLSTMILRFRQLTPSPIPVESRTLSRSQAARYDYWDLPVRSAGHSYCHIDPEKTPAGGNFRQNREEVF
jgi:hypothetical protein